MVKYTFTIAAAFFFCSFSTSLSAQTSTPAKPEAPKPAYKFLDDITVNPSADDALPELQKTTAVPSVKKGLLFAAQKSDGNIEAAGGLQFKYSQLLDVEVELVKNISLLRVIDEWYGVRYLFGGGTKQGIDCSALMQMFFTAAYGISLPRTAKMQYDFSRKISRTELKEGDLLFFDTRGGVSHVGMYLMNNKFVHASAKGVAISDMFDPYYARHLIATGRILDEPATAQVSNSPKP